MIYHQTDNYFPKTKSADFYTDRRRKDNGVTIEMLIL